MKKAVLLTASIEEQSRSLVDILQKLAGRTIGVRISPGTAELGQLSPQIPLADQSDTGRRLVHPQGERRQDLEDLHLVQNGDRAAGEAAGQVPMAQEGLDAGLIEGHAPLRERDPLPFHHCEDGQQERIRRQGTDARIPPHGRQKLLPLPCCIELGNLRGTARRPLQGGGPLLDEDLDLLVLQIDQGRFRQPWRFGTDLPIAHDPAGEDELVAGRLVEGVEVLDPLHQQVAVLGVPHLVQAIEEEEHPPLLKRRLDDRIERESHIPLAEIPDEEVEQRNVPVRQSLGIGGKRHQERQTVTEADALPLPGGERQSQEFQEGALARPGIAEQDQPVVALQQLQDRLCGARTAAQGLLFRLGQLPAGDALSRPGLPLRRLDPRVERDVHFEQRQPQRDAVGNSEAAEIQKTVALHDVPE